MNIDEHVFGKPSEYNYFDNFLYCHYEEHRFIEFLKITDIAKLNKAVEFYKGQFARRII